MARHVQPPARWSVGGCARTSEAGGAVARRVNSRIDRGAAPAQLVPAAAAELTSCRLAPPPPRHPHEYE